MEAALDGERANVKLQTEKLNELRMEYSFLSEQNSEYEKEREEILKDLENEKNEKENLTNLLNESNLKLNES